MKKYLEDKGIMPSEAVMVGDRPLTDILGGIRLGCITILVDSINAENEKKEKYDINNIIVVYYF